MHQIGAGVLGPVFRAYRPPHDRPFAVKAFHIDITPEQAETLTELFGRLVSAGAFHRGAVPATAVGIDDGVLYLAQEYVAAESLDVAMRRYAPTPLERALPLIDRLAGAIDAAHARGLAHGGLHLRDIFATPSGGRVTGFGVVPALEEMGVMGPIRRPYTAPEMIARRPWGGAADRFALAAVAYELLTGKRATGTGTQFAARLDEVENVADVEALQAVFETALADKPDDRYPSALRFATDVRAAVGMPREDEPEEEPEGEPAPPPASQPAATVAAAAGVVPDVIIRDEETVAAGEPGTETGAKGARDGAQAVAGHEDLRAAAGAAEAPEDPPAQAGSTTSAGREAAEASDSAPRRAGRYGLAGEDRDLGDEDDVAFEVEAAREDDDEDEAAPGWSDAGLGVGLAGARDFAGRADDPDASGAGEDVPYRRGASGSVLAIAVVLSVGAGAAYVVGLRLAGEPGRAGAPVAAGEIALSAAPAGTPPSAEASRPEADAGAPALDPPAVSPPAAPPAAAPSPGAPAAASSPAPAAASPPPAAVSPTPLPAVAPSPGAPATLPPPPAAVSPPPPPITPSPPPPPADAPPPAVSSPPPVTAPPPPSPAASPPAAPAADAPEPAPVAADTAAPVGGWLLIRTTPPGAAVTVNGEDHGRTPLALSDMPFGAYRVEVGLEGFQSVTRELGLTPDATVASAAIELPRAAAPPPEPVVGGIAVTSRPSGARVLLDGREVGVTPTVISDVAAGAHDLRIELDGYRPWLTSVDVPAADQVRVGASLDHLPER